MKINRARRVSRRALLAVTAFSGSGQTINQLRNLENKYRVRLGVSATNTASGAHVTYRDGERFAMCSTFKVLAADIVPSSPITSQHLPSGMTIEQLCGAAITHSDNTASNQLRRAWPAIIRN